VGLLSSQHMMKIDILIVRIRVMKRAPIRNSRRNLNVLARMLLLSTPNVKQANTSVRTNGIQQRKGRSHSSGGLASFNWGIIYKRLSGIWVGRLLKIERVNIHESVYWW
jgi:hypothetical protein